MTLFAGGSHRYRCLIRMAMVAWVLTLGQIVALGHGWEELSRPGAAAMRRLHNVPTVTWQQVQLVSLPGPDSPGLALGEDGSPMENSPPPPPPVRVPEGGSMLVMLGLGTAGILGFAKWMTQRHPLPPPTPMEGELSPPGS